MRGTDASGTFKSLRLAWLASVLVLIGGWLLAAVAPAGAAFPGRHGRIAFASDRVTAGNPEGATRSTP